MEGALHVVTVRSQRASAALGRIAFPDLPSGVVAILAHDIPGKPYLRWGDAHHPILAQDIVRYVGQPIALVASPELEVARRVAAEVTVRYEDPAEAGLKVWDPDAATMSGEAGEEGGRGMTAAAAAARQIVTSARRHAPPAPQEALADWEGDTMVIRTATQDPFHVRDTVAEVLDLPLARVRVLAESLDGPGGKLLMPSLVAAHAALACARTGSPARVRHTWREELGASFRIAGCVGGWDSASDPPDGPRVPARLWIAFEGGAYDPMAGLCLRRALQAFPGPYGTSIHLSASYRFTETVPCELPPGCGELEATLVRELWVTENARTRGLDPATHRLELLEHAADRSGAGRRRGSPELGSRCAEVIREVVRRSEFHRRYAACAVAAERRDRATGVPHRGIGIALATFTAGLGEEAEAGFGVRMVMGRDRRVTIRTSLPDNGHGSPALYAAVACQVLGLPADSVTVAPVDTKEVPNTGPCAASRGAAIVAPLVRKCARLLKTRASRGRLPVGAESLCGSLRTLAGAAATVATVHVDGATGMLQCTSIWSALDVGEILDPARARTVAAASIARGLAIALVEQAEPAMVPVPPATDPLAAPVPSYEVVRIGDLCPIDVRFLEHALQRPARASAGISELAILGVPAAIVAAAEQALGRAVGRVPIPLETTP